MYSLQPICLWTLRQLIIVVYVQLIQDLPFLYSLFLTDAVGIPIIKFVVALFCCCQAQYEDMVVRKNIIISFNTIIIYAYSHLISLSWWVDCCVCCCLYRQSFVLWIAYVPNQLCLFSRISTITFVSRDGLRDLSWHVSIANSDNWCQSVRLTH